MKAHKNTGSTQIFPKLRLYNTLSKSLQEVTPLEDGHVRMYSCGPTVYRYIHIGNLRTFAMADWIRRTLQFTGIRVTHIKNITDVGHMRQERLDRGEDKMVSQARQEGKSPWDIAAFYTEAFMRDEQAFQILPAHVFPRATDHIAEMLSIIQSLLQRGFAYEAQGNVFFNVRSYADYGRLSGNSLEHLGGGMHIVNENDPFKRAPEDFPLWKAAEDGRIMAWDSPWGRGFPGWHIECSAMSRKYLGESFDIHTGGVDNIFPHHEDERAQSEGSSGKHYAQIWTHGQHLLADGLKMAKSSGNAYTLEDIQARGFDPLALRFLYCMAHYRSQINFTFSALRSAQTALRRLRLKIAALHSVTGGVYDHRAALQTRAGSYYSAMLAAIADNLNIPKSLALAQTALRDMTLPNESKLGLLLAFDEIWGLNLKESADILQRTEQTPSDIPADAQKMLARRAKLRRQKAYAEADALRAELYGEGFMLRDDALTTTAIPIDFLRNTISSSKDIPFLPEEPDRYRYSVNLLTYNSRADAQRCLESVARNAKYADGRPISLEFVILDNGSTDDTLDYLRSLEKAGAIYGFPVTVLFADHNMGFAAGRNATFKQSRGAYIVMLDTSMEVNGDIWSIIDAQTQSVRVGLIGPYGLVTTDLKEFQESSGPDVDAVEGYCMVFPKSVLAETGMLDEKFRFYRLMDIDYSFEVKKAGYRVVASSAMADRMVKHEHREWYQLNDEERAAKSKKNFDIFRRKRHHCQSLLVMNFHDGQPAPWGHDHILEDADPRFEHGPTADIKHTHEHKHWPDHSHTHPHTHGKSAQWFHESEESEYPR